jgi:serine/threonine protein phosphatase PrpC
MNRIRRTGKQQSQTSSDATTAEPDSAAAEQREVSGLQEQGQVEQDALLGRLPDGVSLPADADAPVAANGATDTVLSAPEVPTRTRRGARVVPVAPAETPAVQEAAAAPEVVGLDDAGPDPLTVDGEVAAPEQLDDASAEETAVIDSAPVAEGEETLLSSGMADLADRDTDPALDTNPGLVSLDQEELTSLPINFVVDSKYVIGSLLHHAEDRNLYRVSTRKQQKCPQCGRISTSSLSDCPQCGMALIGLPAADFYLMAESHGPSALMQDPGIMELNLYHPNLVPVIDFFNHKPYGHTRYYAVAEPRQGVRLSQLSLPRSGGQVLNWAMQLADALDYLHSRGVVGAGAESDDILVQGDRASLASLQNARTRVESADEMTQQQVIDLARLAGTMYEAYTGHPAAMSPEGILPMPSSAPEQVGNAFRTAIEPAQGIAPPVSAARWRDLLAVALEAVAELERPGTPVAFTAAGLTNVGRLRDNNQDSFGMAEFVQGSAERPLRIGLYVVADGLGGHKGGEIASALAIQAFYGEVLSRVVSSLVAAPAERAALNNESIFAGMVRAVQSANERIYRARDNRQNDMGTTIVAALVAGGKAYIVNVGDSRLYHYARPRGSAEAAVRESAPIFKGTTPLAGTAPLLPLVATQPPAGVDAEETEAQIDRSEYTLSQVSVDHSLVHRLVELGQLDPEEAKVHPHRNFIYRSLGGAPPVEVDTFVRTLQPGDRILLCSDGLNSMVEDEMIEGVLAAADDPNIAAHKLIEIANEAGGHDNITTIVIDVTDYLPLADHPTALNNM